MGDIGITIAFSSQDYCELNDIIHADHSVTMSATEKQLMSGII